MMASVVGPVALVAGVVVLVVVSSWAFSTYVLIPRLEREEQADADRAATQAYIAQLRRQARYNANKQPANWRPPSYKYNANKCNHG